LKMFGGFKNRVIEYIILVNAFMFIVTLAVHGSAPSFTRDYLALTPARILQMPWTLVTSMFIHADFTHILFNMFFGVWMFGTYLDRIIGEREFTKVYFIGGIAAGVFYILLSLGLHMPDPRTAVLGASGAVFAIIGALVVLRPNMTLYVYFLFPMPLWVFAAVYMFYGMVAIPADIAGNTAVTAHLGGLIAGLIMGQIYKAKYAQPPQYNYVRYY
jgi:uncharacterized protein